MTRKEYMIWEASQRRETRCRIGKTWRTLEPDKFINAPITIPYAEGMLE